MKQAILVHFTHLIDFANFTIRTLIFQSDGGSGDFSLRRAQQKCRRAVPYYDICVLFNSRINFIITGMKGKKYVLRAMRMELNYLPR